MNAKKIVNAVLWGTGFITVGVLLLLDTLNVIDFDFSKWWPLIIVFIGVSIILDGLFGADKH